MPLTDLTPMEQSILDFARAWWQSPGPKGDAIRARLQISPSAYYRRLDALIDHPDAMARDPLLVRRLRRARRCEELRVGNACVTTRRSCWTPWRYKTTNTQ